jgi:DNA-binding CsgD family transcriptional regulator
MERDSLKHRETVKQMSANGKSQREIAEAIGLSVATVNRLLRADKQIEHEDSVQSLKRKMREHDERIAAMEKRGELPPDDVMFKW